ncbi:MAG: fused MFS/spermidine synthase [Nitrosopumilus sp.]|nr:fused MFS/spermidine synthase [Nitrosopumilus sp.]
MTAKPISKFRQDNLWELRILTFTSGSIIMGLEIVTSRILTPVFGSTVYTWGSLIGVILSGLSLGYFLGGKMADNHPRFDKICGIVFSVGLFIVSIPFFASQIVNFSVAILPGTQYAPLLATFLLLMLPSVFLGFVSPYVIKLGTRTLKSVGNISGNLYSVATIGSIFGTFLTVFVLIPNFSVNQIIFGLGIVLIGSSLIGLKNFPKVIAVAVLIILLVPWTWMSVHPYPHYGTLVYEKETLFSHLDVTEFGDNRSLYLDGMQHSSMNRNDPLDLVIDYTEYFHLGMMFNPDATNVLFVGGGGFTGPKNFLALYPDTKIDVIEIDSDVIDVAKEHFDLKEGPRLQVFNDDARKHLSLFEKKYDLIVLDAYASTYVPYHLMTHEFFQTLEERLEPDGVIVSNLLGSIEGSRSQIVKAVFKTMKETFPVAYVFPTESNPTNLQNVMVVSSNKPYEFDRLKLFEIAKNNPSNYLVDELSVEDHFYQKPVDVSKAPIITDQRNPLETMINPLTSQRYVQELQDKTTEESQDQEGLQKYSMGLSLAFFTAIWLIYFKKEIWQKQNLD